MTVLRLLLTAFDRDDFSVNLEPEGAEHQVPGRSAVTIDFPEGTRVIEVSWHPDGLSVCRDPAVPGYPKVHADGGRTLDW